MIEEVAIQKEEKKNSSLRTIFVISNTMVRNTTF